MQREDLENLTKQHPDCLVAAYADISSGITLISGQRQPIGQEALDRLCQAAALRLGATEKPPLGVATCPMAIKCENGQFSVFIRDPEDENCALNLVCDSSSSLPLILKDVIPLFQSNSGGEQA